MSLNDEERQIMVRLEYEKADYNCDWCCTEDIIMPMKDKAKKMLLAIKEHINDLLVK